MGEGAESSAEKQKWIESIGIYRYYSYILGEFNPIVADAIYNLPAHLIAESFVSKLANEFRPTKKGQ
jgi:hypothetical protein